jgi:hypothetical protein
MRSTDEVRYHVGMDSIIGLLVRLGKAIDVVITALRLA